ncbi:MAG: hypothetical protein ACK58L_08130, partial [Planctomycetota bacterium]
EPVEMAPELSGDEGELETQFAIDSAARDVASSLVNSVDLSSTSLQPVVYVYNSDSEDGSYNGVAAELIEISPVQYNENGELIAGPVLQDRLTGSQYLLPEQFTLVSDRDLTEMLQYFGISEYRVEDQGRWVIPVSPDEGIGFLNRASSLTYYDEIQSYLLAAGENVTDVFSPTDVKVEVVFRAADPETSSDVTLTLPDTRIGFYYETVTVGADGNVTVASPDPNEERQRGEQEEVVEEGRPRGEEAVVAEIPQTEASEEPGTIDTETSAFNQWYESNRDTILEAWSNALSGPDRNDDSIDLSQLWNDTLRSLYGAELPWDNQTTVETDDSLSEADGSDVVQSSFSGYRDISAERITAANGDIAENVEQAENATDVEEARIANLSGRPLSGSMRLLNTMSSPSGSADRGSQAAFRSDLRPEFELTGSLPNASNELSEVSVRESGDQLVATPSTVRSGSLFLDAELDVLDEFFVDFSLLSMNVS